MPYIDKEARDNLGEIQSTPNNASELNYVITQLLDDYISRKGGLKYSILNEVIGVMECSKLEIYRRLVAPYEDIKIEENGDVYFKSKDNK